MGTNILELVFSLDQKHMLLIFILASSFLYGLYLKYWNSHYTKNLKSMNLITQDSSLKVRNNYFTGIKKFTITNPPPTDENSIKEEKLNSFIKDGYFFFNSYRSSRKLVIIFKKAEKLKPYKLSKNKIKAGMICYGQRLDNQKLYYGGFSHFIVSGLTGFGKSTFFAFLTSLLIKQKYSILFCSTLNDKIKGAANFQLTKEAHLKEIISSLNKALEAIEEDTGLQLRTYLIIDEFGDFLSLSQGKNSVLEKEFLKLVVRLIRLGRKNSFFVTIGSQNILASELNKPGLSRGMFPVSIAFRTSNLKAFENIFGSTNPAKKLKEPGVFFLQNKNGEQLHIQCPTGIKE